MNKEELSEYQDLIKESIKIYNRIDKLKKQSEIASDVVQNGYKGHAVITGIDVIRKKKLRESEDKLLDRQAKTIIAQCKIEDFIKEINKSEIRQIFEHKYIDGMNWVQIEIEMEYESEDTARKKHDRYLKKIKKI